MFTTALAIAFSSIGVSASAAALLISLMTSRKQEAFKKSFTNKVEAESALLFGAVRAQSAQMVAAHASKAAQAVAILDERLEGLEVAATEHLITRAEVSNAFAELAAIEEQRQRQTASLRAAAAPAPAIPGAAAVDPWQGAATLEPAPSDPAALISEITAMNERLRDKLRGAGVIGQRPA